MRENAAVKARRLLGEGRVLVLRVDGRDIDAIVRGDSAEFYRVTHRPGSWICSCPALGTCSHLRACMLVTVPARRVNGWRSITELTDTWRDVPVQPWELLVDDPPRGNRTAR